MTFYCFVRGERAGGPWHKAFEGRWQQECEFYSQDLCVGMLSLRSAQESSLFFPLIILYCQLRLVLAAYSLHMSTQWAHIQNYDTTQGQRP